MVPPAGFEPAMVLSYVGLKVRRDRPLVDEGMSNLVVTHPHQESNLDNQFRKLRLCPLSYEGLPDYSRRFLWEDITRLTPKPQNSTQAARFSSGSTSRRAPCPMPLCPGDDALAPGFVAA